MQQTQAYLYPNRIWCQLLLDSTIDTRNPRVYAPNIKIYKNINNVVQVVFYNKDRRRIPVNTYRFIFSIFPTNSPTTNIIKEEGSDTTYREVDVDEIDIKTPILEYELEVLDDGVATHLRGLTVLNVPGADLVPFTADQYTYSIKAFDEFDSSYPAYVDDNTGVQGVIEIIDGAYSPTEVISFVDLGTI